MDLKGAAPVAATEVNNNDYKRRKQGPMRKAKDRQTDRGQEGRKEGGP
jgi:hypothetical protein